MVPLLGKPLMERTVELLRENGITDICATLGYNPAPILSHFGGGEDFGVHLSWRIEDKPLGTADIALYAHIHYGQASPSIAAEGVDRTSALEEVADLNFGHFLPGGAHALEGDVVVGGEQNHGFFGEGWACPPGYPGKADG